MKQHGMFGEATTVTSRNEAWAKQVEPATAHDAMYAAFEAGGDPYAAEVKTRAGTVVTIRQCEAEKMTGPNRISDLMEAARQRVTVKQALAAGQDPYAAYYTLPMHEAYDAIYTAFQQEEDPAELEFTVWFTWADIPERTIKLSECNFAGTDATFEQLVDEVRSDLERYAAQMRKE